MKSIDEFVTTKPHARCVEIDWSSTPLSCTPAAAPVSLARGRRPMKFLAIVVLVIVVTSGAAQNRSEKNWPSFRGPSAAGIADGQNLPDRWDGEQGTNIQWKVTI